LTHLCQPNEIESNFLNPQRLPLVLEPRAAGLSLLEFASRHINWIETTLVAEGAILFRNFRLDDPAADFHQFSNIVAGTLADYVYRSTPRTSVSKNVYTATEYPAKMTIPQHNENAYSRRWPMKLMFLCAEAAPEGGATPLSRNAAVTRRISKQTRDKFRDLGVLYARNYGPTLDLPWQVVFQTTERQGVEAFCRENGIGYAWGPNDTLRTTQVCQALASHPITKEELWFNQAHLFHVTNLDPATRAAMLSLFSEEQLPRNAYFGDGSAIDPAMLDEIRLAFTEELAVFGWQTNDVLLVDNMLVSHGRQPFRGPRKILVAMGQESSVASGSPDASDEVLSQSQAHADLLAAMP